MEKRMGTMPIYLRELDQLFIQMKKQLKEVTGYAFSIDTEETFSFQVEEQIVEFELYYKPKQELLILEFHNLFWHDQERGALVETIVTTIMQVIEQSDLHCFVRLETTTYYRYFSLEFEQLFDDQFELAPVGKCAHQLLNLYRKMNVVMQKDHHIFIPQAYFPTIGFEVFPVLTNTPAIELFAMDKRGYNLSERHKETPFYRLETIEDYHRLMNDFDQAAKEAEDIRDHILSYVSTQTGILQPSSKLMLIMPYFTYDLIVTPALSGVFHVKCGVYQQYNCQTKEDAIASLLLYVEELLTLNNSLQHTIEDIKKTYSVAFCELDVHGLMVHLAEETLPYTIKLRMLINPFTGEKEVEYTCTSKEYTQSFDDAKSLCNVILKEVEQAYSTIRLRHLFTPGYIPHLARFTHEAQAKKVIFDQPISHDEFKHTLKVFYETQASQTISFHHHEFQLEDFVITKTKDQAIIVSKKIG